MTKDEIRELITRRRRQILVHSIIYYKLDDCIVSDNQWAEWAVELEELQNDYPDIADECPFADAFEGFEHSSGYNLPLDNPWGVHKARYLIEMRDRKSKGENS